MASFREEGANGLRDVLAVGRASSPQFTGQTGIAIEDRLDLPKNAPWGQLKSPG
jgi:hypothetical protein